MLEYLRTDHIALLQGEGEGAHALAHACIGDYVCQQFTPTHLYT